MLFSTMAPNASQAFCSVSAISGNGKLNFSMKFSCERRLSFEMPTMSAPAFLVEVAEILALLGAAGRVVLGIEIHH
jgi:hypothetical protein